MAEFNVTLSELVNKANQLSELNQTFKGQVSSMSDIENGLNGMWEGEAAKYQEAEMRNVEIGKTRSY